MDDGSSSSWTTTVLGALRHERDEGALASQRWRLRSTDKKLIGRDLVNGVFADKGTLAASFDSDSERQGYRDLYAGVVGVFRNPSAHQFIDPSPEDGGAFIVFVNLLLRKLEDLR